MTNLNFPDASDYADFNIESGLNDMLLAADQAWRKDETLDLSSGNASPSIDLARRTMLWRLSGVATSGRTVTLPAVAKPYLVQLPEAATDTVDIIKGSTTLTHPIGATRWYYSGSGANDLVSPDIPGGGINSVTPSDYVGCIVQLGPGEVSVTGQVRTALDLRTKVIDTHGFHENVTNPTRITIPDGVDYVIFRVGLLIQTNIGTPRLELIVDKNGGGSVGVAMQSLSGTQDDRHGKTYETGPISVTSGDYFEFVFRSNEGGTRTLEQTGTWFECQVVGGPLFEGAYAGVPYDVEMGYVAATPGATTVIYKRMVAEDIRFPPDFAASVASVDTNPSGTTTIDIDDDGVTIGTLAFDTSGVPTFATVSNTEKLVAAGSRIEFVTQGSVNGIAGIAATLKGLVD